MALIAAICLGNRLAQEHWAEAPKMRKCFYTLWAGSSPSLPDGSNPSAAIVQSASDVQCSRLLKTTAGYPARVAGKPG
ncbi:hypothetical protein IPC1511_29700 [Pseudomonas aeruginosa]|nr:hypothetical protein IPC1511_29700 [Pseudomonas aeruginosa]TED92820.1 hypothetical protein IPC1510_33450 [Pseudomonas aeruginosa]